MPNGVLRRIKPLVERAEGCLSAGAIPADGITLDAFAREVVPFVAPEDVGELLKRLHRRKVVWVSRNRGAVRVYPEKPANPAKPMPIAPSEVDAFLGAIVLPMMRLVDALVKDRLADHEGAYAEDVACGRAIDVVRQHAARGSDLAAMRSAMWRLFPERAMRRIAWHEPRLAHDATDTAFAAPREPRRLPGWLTTEERILALIGKAGSRGMTANDLQHNLAPRPSREDMAGELARLKAEGKVIGVATGRQRGRPSVRWVVV